MVATGQAKSGNFFFSWKNMKSQAKSVFWGQNDQKSIFQDQNGKILKFVSSNKQFFLIFKALIL